MRLRCVRTHSTLVSCCSWKGVICVYGSLRSACMTRRTHSARPLVRLSATKTHIKPCPYKRSEHTSITDAPDVQHSQRTGVPSNPGKLCCSRSSGGWASEWSDSSTGDVKGDDDEKPGSSAVSDSISGGRCRGRGGCGAKQRRGAAREATVHCWVGDGAEVARFTPPGRLRH